MLKRIHFAAFLFLSYLIFSLWVYTYGTEHRSGMESMNAEAYKGKLLYQELNCSSCHQIFGLGGYLGPDLTNVISQPGKGRNYVAALLNFGLLQMPDFHLDSVQAGQIVSFLSFVDSSSTLEKSAQKSLSKINS